MDAQQSLLVRSDTTLCWAHACVRWWAALPWIWTGALPGERQCGAGSLPTSFSAMISGLQAQDVVQS